MKHIISATVENHAGVLSKISGLFSRRGYNIESLTVGTTEDPTVSVMTIIVDGDDYIAEQVMKQLNKLIDVIKIKQLDKMESVSRELALIKVYAEPPKRPEIIQIADIFRGKVVDVSADSLTIEVTGTTDKLQALVDLMRPYGIKEMVRTGTVSIARS